MKMKMETANKTLENLAKLKEMFPEVITETRDENGEIVAAVDAKKLEQLLSTKVIEGDECYDFTWVGKKQAMVEACKPIRKTLRPCREESVDLENTQNLYIEGDNLDVLKLLQESYLSKVKMIYIDPPYNTGNDSFIYPDDYSTNKELYDEEVGAIDESGYRMFKNTETNGRFHSSWCSMMYPRLKLARNLLSEDGVIFISIDDNEVDNIKKMCDEIFGESNCLGLISTINNLKGRSDSEFFATCNEFLLVYSKNKVFAHTNGFEVDMEEIDDDYKFEDEISKYKVIGFRKTGNGWKREDRPYMYYPVLEKNGSFSTVEKSEYIKIYDSEQKCFNDEYVDKLRIKYEQNGYRFILPKDEKGEYGRWRWGLDTFFNEKDINLAFNSAGTLCTKMRATIENGSVRVKTAKTLWYKPEYDTGTSGKILKSLFSKDIFNNPKSPIYIFDMLKIGTNKNSIILDFFSGSATTAHAVMQLNAEDGGHRKFIMVQLPEICDEKSEAYKAGYKNICEIGKERIRRAGKKIVEETGKKDLDIGFRVLKLDSSNMKDVYYAPADYKQTMLEKMTSNIEDGRTAEDLLYACMLEWGLELSLPHKVQKIAGFDVHIVNNGDLVACFDDKVSEEAIKQIAEMKPLRAVFRDSSFATDAARVNVGEIFKLKSPNTTIKVL